MVRSAELTVLLDTGHDRPADKGTSRTGNGDAASRCIANTGALCSFCSYFLHVHNVDPCYMSTHRQESTDCCAMVNNTEAPLKMEEILVLLQVVQVVILLLQQQQRVCCSRLVLTIYSHFPVAL